MAIPAATISAPTQSPSQENHALPSASCLAPKSAGMFESVMSAPVRGGSGRPRAHREQLERRAVFDDLAELTRHNGDRPPVDALASEIERVPGAPFRATCLQRPHRTLVRAWRRPTAFLTKN